MMKRKWATSIVTLSLLGLIVAGCQEEADTSSQTVASTESTETEEKTEATESAETKEHTHDHHHSHDEEAKKAASGQFEDDQVKDRALSDWAGDWQSLYPYLLNGVLDPVWQHKAEHNQDKTFEEYKKYYTIGYETDVERIVIDDNTMTFYKNGKGITGEYKYHGFEILTYESGKKGVRYLFDLVEEVEGLPKSVQFSDHIIAPQKSGHYHIYFGNEDHDTLLQELENWPTYFPSSLNESQIVEEMVAH